MSYSVTLLEEKKRHLNLWTGQKYCGRWYCSPTYWDICYRFMFIILIAKFSVHAGLCKRSIYSSLRKPYKSISVYLHCNIKLFYLLIIVNFWTLLSLGIYQGRRARVSINHFILVGKRRCPDCIWTREIEFALFCWWYWGN